MLITPASHYRKINVLYVKEKEMFCMLKKRNLLYI